MAPTPVLLPGKSHGWRSLLGCSPWGREESDATEWLHFYFSLSCIGKGNGNLLQCSCLKNPRDGAWWAAICGVAKSRTQLKQLSSSSSSSRYPWVPYKVEKKYQVYRMGILLGKVHRLLKILVTKNKTKLKVAVTRTEQHGKKFWMLMSKFLNVRVQCSFLIKSIAKVL